MAIIVRESGSLVRQGEAQAYYKIQSDLEGINKSIQKICSSSIEKLRDKISSESLSLSSTRFRQVNDQVSHLSKEIQLGLGTIDFEVDLKPEFLKEVQRFLNKKELTYRTFIQKKFSQQLINLESTVIERVQGHLQKIQSHFQGLLLSKKKIIDNELRVFQNLISTLKEFLKHQVEDELSSSLEEVFGSKFEEIHAGRVKAIASYESTMASLRRVIIERESNLEDQLKKTKEKISVCKQKAEECLARELQSDYDAMLKGKTPDDSGVIFKMLDKVSSAYFDSSKEYQSLVEIELNRYIQDMQQFFSLLLEKQDKEVISLIEKISAIKEFLEEETKIVLSRIQQFQELKPSIAVGSWNYDGKLFDETSASAYGEVRGITVNSGWWVDGFTILHGSKKKAVQYGEGGGRSKISLEKGERITKIMIGTGIQQAHNWRTNGIDSVTFETNKQTKFGPYGCGHGKTPPKTIDIGFGDDYYFCGIRGQLVEGNKLGQIVFVFKRDFSRILAGDLQSQVRKLNQILKEQKIFGSSSDGRKLEVLKGIIESGIRTNAFRLNPYSIMGLSRNSISLQELEARKKILMKEFHPDKAEPGFTDFATNRFQLVLQAYQMIFDEIKERQNRHNYLQLEDS